MLISLEVNDNDAKSFVEFLSKPDFVKIQRSELDHSDYLQLLNERLQEHKTDPDSGEDAKEVLEELRKKYNF